MAERALLVRRRDDGRYDVASARWGGTDRALAAVCGGTRPRRLPGVSWTGRPEPVAFDEFVGRLDYLSTAVLYRARDDQTAVFLPLWFGLGLPDARPAVTVGALVAVASLPDARALRRQFRRLKGTLVDALAAGDLPATAAPVVLRAAVAGAVTRERHLSSTVQ